MWKRAEIQEIGIVGAGQMGSGIAHVSAMSGYTVVLQDINEEQINKAQSTISKNLDRQLKKGAVTADQVQIALGKIQFTTEMSAFKDCGLVIEAATENETVKAEIFSSLLSHLHEAAILATNTSSLSITRLAAQTDRPERFMGIHFMNPVPLMELVELIRGIGTSSDTFEACLYFVKSLDKQTAVSEDYPAFIVNRILIPMINEAAFTLYEGVGSVESIDTALKLGANHPMGPLQLADFIGLDTCLAIMNVLYEGFADSKYRPCPLLVNYVEAGWLGRKTGRGFYDYSAEQPVPTR